MRVVEGVLVSEGLRREGCWSDFILYRRWDALLTAGEEHRQFQSRIKCMLTSIVGHRAEYLVSHTEVAEGLSKMSSLNQVAVAPRRSPRPMSYKERWNGID